MKIGYWVTLLIFLVVIGGFVFYTFCPPGRNNLPAAIREDSITHLKARIQGYKLDSGRIRLKMFTDSLRFAEALERHKIEIKRLKNNVKKVDLHSANNLQLDSVFEKLYPSPR